MLATLVGCAKLQGSAHGGIWRRSSVARMHWRLRVHTVSCCPGMAAPCSATTAYMLRATSTGSARLPRPVARLGRLLLGNLLQQQLLQKLHVMGWWSISVSSVQAMLHEVPAAALP